MNTIGFINGLSKAAGGTSYSVPELSNALAKLGRNRTLINIYVKQDGESNFPDPGLVHTLNVYGVKFSFIRWAPQLPLVISNICREWGINLIHAHGVWQPGTHTAVRVSKKLKIPIVITTHGMLTQWHFNHKAWKKRPAWWLYQKRDLETARVVHITSKDEGDDLRKIGFKGPMALISNGSEIPEWREPKAEPKVVRTALFFSRIHLKKGLLNLVEAWAIVRPKGWRMLIVGPDTEGYGRVVKDAVRKKGLENEFVFMEPVYGDAKWDLYRNADLFILPTFTENFGIVIPEAMACGLPVITTYGAPWSELNEMKCGWWIPIGVEPLVAALRQATERS
ncbi:MAG TPA: glycosyltransferase, partial [bacterium]